MTHYEVLGIPQDANEETIRAAYRKAAREFHPDVNPAPEARASFEAASLAYETLTDTERRKAYDAIIRVKSERDRAEEIRANMARIREERERNREADLARKADERREDHMRATQTRATDQIRIMADTMNELASQGRMEEADRTAAQILQLDAKFAPAYAVRAEWALQRGNARAATQFMAFAAQNAPHIAAYEQKYRQLLGRGAAEAKPNEMAAETEASASPLVGAGFLAAALAFYPVLATEPLLMPDVSAINQWTVGTVTTLIVAGFGLGLAGAWKRFLSPMSYHLGPSSQAVAPLTWLIISAPFSLWLSAIGLAIMFWRSRALPPAVGRALALCIATVAIFALVGMLRGPDYAMQTALWGGNLAAVGLFLGWWMGDLRSRR
ncbi:MAG: DnaJ domain-containing protein [Fimbriimonadaceae bacterium]|nr:DnaJ domain-containing protein [Fimbriimonadaceae bacterium]